MRKWVFHPQRGPYYSCGNGSAMRVGPVGFACGSIEEVLSEARRSAEVTHNHPEGIKGAQAVALAVYLARTGVDRDEIKREIAGRFGYNLNRRLDDIREEYRFDVTCQGSVPESVIAFL
jgi:ADP-ribosylglycohydrolase